MKAKPVAEPPEPLNRLGEWTANLIRISRIQLMLAVNDRTRLALAIDAAPYATIPERFAQQLLQSLLWLDIDGDRAGAEAEATRPTALATSNSRSVLSTITRMSLDVEAWIRYGTVRSAMEVSQRLLEEIVLEPKHILFPADRVREAFSLPPLPRRRWGPDIAANDPW
ncbi:MAG TPA: hypothetical protein VLI06_10575 [Solimonas sp.]|nr:hypothetical protein [Solimonas sp.]